MRRRREGTPINITSIFYKIHFAKSNFTPEFLLHIPSWETTSAGIFLGEHFVGHSLIVSKCVLSADSRQS
jgi:hypothetical protein